MKEPQAEHDRLSTLYASMSNEELEKLASAGYELSDIALAVLQAEISRRGVPILIDNHPGTAVYELKDTVVVRQFRDLHEALLAKGCLESAGIPADLVDDNMVRLDWFYSNLIGGVKLKVRKEDADLATQILDQPIPDSLSVEGVGEYQQPKCPKCESLDVSFQELNKLLSFGSAYLGVPIPVYTKAWSCHACGHQWEDDPTPAEAGEVEN